MQVIIENNKLICPYCEQEFKGHNTGDYDSVLYQGTKGLKFIKRCNSCGKEVIFYRFGLLSDSNGSYKIVKESEIKKIDSKKVDKGQ